MDGLITTTIKNRGIELIVVKVKEGGEQYITERMKTVYERGVMRNLIEKVDASRSRSEKGYQLIAATTCRQIARYLGCNEEKAELLNLAIGLVFPKYGHAGLRAVKQYVVDHHYDIDIANYELYCATYYWSKLNYTNNYLVTNTILHELFDDYYHHQQLLESQIVKFVQETIIDIKKAEDLYEGYPGDLLYDVTSEIVDFAKEYKQLMKSEILKQYSIENISLPLLTHQQHDEIYQLLDEYIQTFCFNEVEIFNISQERALFQFVVL